MCQPKDQRSTKERERGRFDTGDQLTKPQNQESRSIQYIVFLFPTQIYKMKAYEPIHSFHIFVDRPAARPIREASECLGERFLGDLRVEVR